MDEDGAAGKRTRPRLSGWELGVQPRKYVYDPRCPGMNSVFCPILELSELLESGLLPLFPASTAGPTWSKTTWSEMMIVLYRSWPADGRCVCKSPFFPNSRTFYHISHWKEGSEVVEESTTTASRGAGAAPDCVRMSFV